MKRALSFFLAILFCFFLLPEVVAEETNLLTNGGFETVSASGDAEGWYATAYRSQPGYSSLKITKDKAHSGQYSALIQNVSANDARFVYTAEVEPNSLYRLSCYVLVDSMEDLGNGANLAIEDIYSVSDTLFDTMGEWQYLEWYGETSETQTSLTFGVRVGGYSSESIGKAYFDDVVLEKVDSLPDSVIASIWYPVTTYSQTETQAEEDTPQKSVLWFLVCAAVFVLCCLILRHWFSSTLKYPVLVLAFGLVLALAVRLILGITVSGYEVDINCFTAWSLRMVQSGPAGFYSEEYFCDYPPGYMLMLWPIGLILKYFSGSATLIVKLWPIFFDLCGAVFLYCFARKKLSETTACFLSLLYALNPAVVINSAGWGQVDSVLAFFLLLTVLFALERNWKAAMPLFFLSVLIKPQAILFTPIGGMFLVFGIAFEKERGERNRQLRDALAGLAIALLVAFLVILPFSIRQENPVEWIVNLYSETISSYDYVTLNTANLYYLFGANWTPLTKSIPLLLPLLFAVLFLALGGWFVLRSIKEKTAKTRTFGAFYGALGIACVVFAFLKPSYRIFGYTMMGAVYVTVILCMLFDRKKQNLPFELACALIGVFTLAVKIHERYLFCAIPLLLMGYADTKDRRMLGIAVGYSVTTFLNVAIILQNSIVLGSAYGHLNSDTLVLNDILCVLNLLLCGYSFFVLLTGTKENPVPAPALPSQEAEEKKLHAYKAVLLNAPVKPRLSKKDALIVSLLTLCYAVLAFTNLGSTVAPQTYWVSTSYQETVTYELEKSQSFTMLYYAGVSYDNFSVQTSEDGVTWSEEIPCRMNEGLCYRWMYALKSYDKDGETVFYSDGVNNVVHFSGKYLRVNACNPGLNLWEIVLRDEDGNTIPLTLSGHENANAELSVEGSDVLHLTDEQTTCVGEPGWYNGTYFDEIYHVRTAYEHLHGQKPYETSHPPLGKLMIAVGIAIFGMTPFGWRFAGALTGVVMLPVMFLLGWRLCRKRSAAYGAMLAFMFDLMHYTQTRIATIDSFPVFFIMVSFLLMIRYLQSDFLPDTKADAGLLSKAYLKSLVPLLLCGIAMGLSIASKWIGIYSAVGLAAVLFLGFWRQLRVNYTANGLNAEDEAYTPLQQARISCAQRLIPKRILTTCAFCVLFFILIPCGIYYLCYIPYLSPTGKVTLERVIQTQVDMFSYHSMSGLGMDHPFYSPWWQWPLILKPMWFAQDSYEPTGYASTIMCMGNPWIYYVGALAIVLVAVLLCKKYLQLKEGALLRPWDGEISLSTILLAFLAQYLPWVLVPRGTYMYHYFASVPFIILATMYLISRIRNGKVRKVVLAVYLLLALAFFVLYFPYASGWMTSTNWLDAVKGWLKLYY